jgi:hypothetical protein
MVHHIWPNAQIVVKRLHSAQFAGADTGEIMTDTAEGNLDEKCLMSVSYDGASNQGGGINGLNAHPRRLVRGSGTKPGQNQFELLNESNHRKRNQYND